MFLSAAAVSVLLGNADVTFVAAGPQEATYRVESAASPPGSEVILTVKGRDAVGGMSPMDLRVNPKPQVLEVKDEKRPAGQFSVVYEASAGAIDPSDARSLRAMVEALALGIVDPAALQANAEVREITLTPQDIKEPVSSEATARHAVEASVRSLVTGI